MPQAKPWWAGDIDDPANHRPDIQCPSCLSMGMDLFYEKLNIPVHSCLMMVSVEEAKSFPTGNLSLGFCRKCGFISNTLYEKEKQDYTTVYEDQQSFSPTFNAFADKLADDLIERYKLKNKHLVEIGCSKGDFLIMMCAKGNNSGIGIDPTAIPGRVQAEGADKVEFIQDYYSEKYSDKVGDMIMCRHTLEHIGKTNEFMTIVRNSIVDRNDTVVFFEVPDVVRVLDEQAFWDIYYEHCSYFSPGSMARLFKQCRLATLNLALEYDDQYLIIESKPVDDIPTEIHPIEESVATMTEKVKNYAHKVDERLSGWHEYLSAMKKEGKKVVAWGSGSKCVSFFSTIGLTDEIEYVVDINPHRQGRFIVGACKEVKSPEFLKEYKPDIVIVMNPIYEKEITEMLSGMGLAPTVKSV